MAPVRGLTRCPNGEVTIVEASGARRPAEGAEARAGFGAGFRTGLGAAFSAGFRAGFDAAFRAGFDAAFRAAFGADFAAAFAAGEDLTWGWSKTSDDPASASREGCAAGAATALAGTSPMAKIPVGAA
jgi:hypothetical protein